MAVPTLDVNDVFLGPEFMSDVLVNRISETVDTTGRVIRMPLQMTAQAVVLATTPNDLQRLPEEEYQLKSIALYSPFRFQGPTEDPVSGARTHPDEIVWHGSTYVVRLLDDWTPYGRGFVHVVAVSIAPVDPAPYQYGNA